MGKFNRSAEKIEAPLCACNCGKPVHFNHGRWRTYLPWHYVHKSKKVLSPPQLCACDCGNMARPGYTYIAGHNSNTGKSKYKSVLCGCGCGKGTRPGSAFISGHNTCLRPGYTKREKSPPQLCACNCGSMTNKNCRFISGHNLRGAEPKSPPQLCECGCGGMTAPGNRFINHHSTPKGGNSTPESIAKMRNSIIELYKNDPRYAEMISKRMKENWADPEFALRMGIAQGITPNKPETVLLNLLNELYPNEWKFTGDFSFMINGKNPDFTNVNGQKKLIEMYGDYWHKDDNPQDRINAFKPFGWDTLVIWEKELKDLATVKVKINEFSEARHGA